MALLIYKAARSSVNEAAIGLKIGIRVVGRDKQLFIPISLAHDYFSKVTFVTNGV